MNKETLKNMLKKKQDWIPRKESEYIKLCGTWLTALSDQNKISAFEWKQTDCTAVSTEINTFLSMRTAYTAVPTKGNRIDKDKAKKSAIKTMRTFANMAIRFNPKISEGEKDALGIHEKDTITTTHEPPTSQPSAVVENTKNHFEHRIVAMDTSTNTATKPEDAYGVHYAWQVGGERPASGAKLSRGHFTRKTNYVVTHTEEEKGMTAYYAACYENSKGVQGPWSPIVEALIG